MKVQVRPRRKIFPRIAEFFQPRRIGDEQQCAHCANALPLNFLERSALD
jgi:hypothetical protein